MALNYLNNSFKLIETFYLTYRCNPRSLRIRVNRRVMVMKRDYIFFDFQNWICFGLVFWHINHCWLFNSKSLFYIYTVLFKTTQFSISTQFNSIRPINRTLSDATTPGQSGPGFDGNKMGFPGGARDVIVIVVGNEYGDTSSNPGRDWLHFT